MSPRLAPPATEPGAPRLATVRLSVGTVALVIFIFVSSGPFGVEDMVASAGPGTTLLLLLVIPVVWGAPLGLACMELASAIPEEGAPTRGSNGGWGASGRSSRGGG